jgi:hypothetical protein
MPRKAKASSPAPAIQSDPLPLPNWPSATMAAFSAGLAYLLPPSSTILELASSAIAAGLRERGFNIAEQPLPLRVQSFSPESFDCVYTVHVTAAMQDFPSLIADIRQLLRPNGFYANLTSIAAPSDDVNHLNVGWETILKRNQVVNAFRLAKRPRVEFENTLKESGATSESIPICRWMEDYNPQQHLDFLTVQKSPLPAEIYKRCLNDYERWIKAHYSDVTQPMQQQQHSSIQLWRWM